MSLRIARAAGLSVVLSSFIATTAFAALSTGEQKRLNDAAGVVTAIRNADNGIPEDLWQKAACVIVIPDMKKAAFIVGGETGSGAMSCRHGSGWSEPIFMELTKASVGFQAGVEVSEVIIVVMTEKGLNSLLSTSFKIGGDASIAAGPVGAGAKSTVTADLISFSRAKGVYGGVNLDGTVVHANTSWNDAYYGRSNLLPPDILIRKTVQSPKSEPLLTAVARAAR